MGSIRIPHADLHAPCPLILPQQGAPHNHLHAAVRVPQRFSHAVRSGKPGKRPFGKHQGGKRNHADHGTFHAVLRIPASFQAAALAFGIGFNHASGRGHKLPALRILVRRFFVGFRRDGLSGNTLFRRDFLRLLCFQLGFRRDGRSLLGCLFQFLPDIFHGPGPVGPPVHAGLFHGGHILRRNPAVGVQIRQLMAGFLQQSGQRPALLLPGSARLRVRPLRKTRPHIIKKLRLNQRGIHKLHMPHRRVIQAVLPGLPR